MFWGILVAAVVLAIVGLLALAVMWDTRTKATAERERLDREHELALADREVEVWKAMAAAPVPSIFHQRRGWDGLVGRSQVLDSFDASASAPLTSRAGWGHARVAERAQEIRETGTTEAHARSGTLEAVPEPSIPGVKPCADRKRHGPHDWVDRSTSDVRQFRCPGRPMSDEIKAASGPQDRR